MVFMNLKIKFLLWDKELSFYMRGGTGLRQSLPCYAPSPCWMSQNATIYLSLMRMGKSLSRKFLAFRVMQGSSIYIIWVIQCMYLTPDYRMDTARSLSGNQEPYLEYILGPPQCMLTQWIYSWIQRQAMYKLSFIVFDDSITTVSHMRNGIEPSNWDDSVERISEKILPERFSVYNTWLNKEQPPTHILNS